jgi:hypothetical protein
MFMLAAAAGVLAAAAIWLAVRRRPSPGMPDS